MDRVLVIDQDRSSRHALGLACLGHGVGVVMAETVCEGVRVLLSTPVTSIVVDHRLVRLTPGEQATLFGRVAPDVSVVVAVGPDTPLDARVAYELAGFRVLTRPVGVEELLDKDSARGGLGEVRA
jgi:DNA-binding NtrC family response regulator